MLLCSENTARTADSTQNKMILYHLSENLCSQQRRKEERGRLQEQQVGGLRGDLEWGRGGHCLMVPHVPLSSPGTRHACITDPRSPPSQAVIAKEQIHGAKGVFHPSRPMPGKQSAAVQAPGSSEGCPATGSCFVCLKEELWQKL